MFSEMMSTVSRTLSRRMIVAGLSAALTFVALMWVPSEVFAVGPVAAKATCGNSDRPETGLQGQMSAVDRAALPARAFTCNLQLKGQALGEGASFGFAVTDTCAYFSQWHTTNFVSGLENPGVAVVDVSDSANPKIVKYLQTPGMMNANESLAVHLGRKLLIATNTDQNLQYGKTTDIYDVSDCLNPVLKFSGIIPGFVNHGGDFTRDGKIFWAAPAEEAPTTSVFPLDVSVVNDPSWSQRPLEANTISALDVTDPSNPKLLAQWKSEDPKIGRFHTVAVSDDGNTAYIGVGRYMKAEKIKVPQGLGVLDVSEVQARKPGAQIKMIGHVYWEETDHNQIVRPFTIKGRKYAWLTDLDGAIQGIGPAEYVNSAGKRQTGPLAFKADVPNTNYEEVCRSGRLPWGQVNLIDVQDPQHPDRVSGLRHEMNEVKNCLATAYEPRYGFGYSALTCDVDNYQDAKMMACTFSEGGLRVFDIRDVKHPRELAYYKPPAAEPRIAGRQNISTIRKGRTSIPQTSWSSPHSRRAPRRFGSRAATMDSRS